MCVECLCDIRRIKFDNRCGEKCGVFQKLRLRYCFPSLLYIRIIILYTSAQTQNVSEHDLYRDSMLYSGKNDSVKISRLNIIP